MALVPGASGGMGSAIARRLAVDGLELVLGFNRQASAVEALAAELSASGTVCHLMGVDVTDSADIERFVRSSIERAGRIDIIANCLGWQDPQGFVPFAEQPEARWMKVLEIELLATMRFAGAVIPHLKANGWGRIITLGSDSAKVGEGGAAANAAARGGCLAFSKSLAREVGRYGVTVNMVCPGPTETPLLQKLAESEHGARVVEKMKSLTALKRIGRPDEVAAAVAFLASEEAGYITGQAISVSGGLTMC